MPRNTGSVRAALLKDKRLHAFAFLRMDFPAPEGTLRWTTYSDGDTASIAQDVEETGTPQIWDCTKVWATGQFSQGSQGALTLSDISFGNADNSWSSRVYTYGWRGIPVVCWLGFYDVDTGAFKGSFVAFQGEGDRFEVGETARGSLVAGRPPWTIKYPRRRFSPAYGFKFIPPPNFVLTWGTRVVTLPPNHSGGGSALTPDQIYGKPPPDIGPEPHPAPVPVPPPPPPRVVPPRG